MIFRFSLPALFALTFSRSPATAAESRVYFGTYTKEGESRGIYHSVFDDMCGKLSYADSEAKVWSPACIRFVP